MAAASAWYRRSNAATCTSSVSARPALTMTSSAMARRARLRPEGGDHLGEAGRAGREHGARRLVRIGDQDVALGEQARHGAFSRGDPAGEADHETRHARYSAGG